MLYWCSDCRKYFSIRTKTAVAHKMFPLRKGHRVAIRPYSASSTRPSKREAARASRIIHDVDEPCLRLQIWHGQFQGGILASVDAWLCCRASSSTHPIRVARGLSESKRHQRVEPVFGQPREMFPGRLLIKLNSRSNEDTPFVNPTEVFDALAWLATAHRNGPTESSSRTNGTGPCRCTSRGGRSLGFPHGIYGPGVTPRGAGTLL